MHHNRRTNFHKGDVMRVWATMAAAAVMMIGLSMPTSAEVTTVTGELVTVMCFTKNGDNGRGDDHAACALKCAKEGYPLALVTSDGEMYKLTGKLTADNNAALQSL